jgi:hypothetical protein
VTGEKDKSVELIAGRFGVLAFGVKGDIVDSYDNHIHV